MERVGGGGFTPNHIDLTTRGRQPLSMPYVMICTRPASGSAARMSVLTCTCTASSHNADYEAAVEGR